MLVDSYPPTGWTPINGVTVGYGSDEAMFDSWGVRFLGVEAPHRIADDWLAVMPRWEQQVA